MLAVDTALEVEFVENEVVEVPQEELAVSESLERPSEAVFCLRSWPPDGSVDVSSLCCPALSGAAAAATRGVDVADGAAGCGGVGRHCGQGWHFAAQPSQHDLSVSPQHLWHVRIMCVQPSSRHSCIRPAHGCRRLSNSRVQHRMVANWQL